MYRGDGLGQLKIAFFLPDFIEAFREFGVNKDTYYMDQGFPNQYCRSLLLLGHDTCLIYLSRELKGVEKAKHVFGHRLLAIPAKGPKHLASMFTALEILKTKEFRESDLVHTFNYYNPLVLFLAVIGILMRKPVIVSSHRSPHKMSLRMRLMVRTILNLAQHIICINVEDVKKLQTELCIKPSRISMIPNGIDADFYIPCEKRKTRLDLGLDSDAKYVLCVSRLHPEKGVHVLLHAFRKVADIVQDSILVIVGIGYFGHELKKLSENLFLDSRVIFAGFVSEETKRKLYSCSHVFVLPSFMEMFPLVILEAMSAGLPIVSTKVGGWTQLSQESELGITVPAGDPDMLADAIIQLLHDPELRTRLGSAGRRLVLQKYTWKRMGENLNRLYSHIVS